MSAEAKIVEVAIGQVKGFLAPSDAERAAAYELLVELTTRPSSAQLASVDVSIGEELRSVEELFDLTRGILRTHGIEGSKGSTGNLSLAVIALRVLNEVYRPVVNRWKPLLADHLALRPDGSITEADWERRWERSQQCRSELNSMRASTRAYIETLSRIAGTPSIADAVLSAPSSVMLPHDRVDTNLHPDSLAAFTPRREMVRWLSPVEMWTTWRSGFRAKKSLKAAAMRAPVVSTGDDGRLLPDARFDAEHGADFWFDYVADMGDGFDGTAPIAWLIGRHSIQLPDHLANEIPTPPASMPRADLLVFGGDEVYPFAAAGAYEAQTELPYRMGLEGGPDASDPMLVAIPGNHDWLGGIEYFEDVFVNPGRRFADQWTTAQTNTWFHVALPQGWWLWGIDTGLHNELIGPQEEYFRSAAESLRPGDRVILCSPVPLTQLRQKYPAAYATLRGTLDPIITGQGATMPLCLSGDSHYFAHYERVDTDAVEDHVTAGGGGAFLQPTHNLAERVPLERGNAEFRLTSRWPLPADSRAIAPGLKWITDPQLIPLFLLAALLQLAFAGLAAIDAGRLQFTPLQGGWSTAETVETSDPGWLESLGNWAASLGWVQAFGWTLTSPWALALLIVVALSGIVAFRGNSVEPKLSSAARIYGLLAGLAVAATFPIVNATRLTLGSSFRWVALALFAFLGGVLSVVVFIKVSGWVNRRIRAADTVTFLPAFSTRFKHFLRFRIDPDGDLTCYAVGLDPVGAGWYESMTPTAGTTSSVPPYDPAGSPRLHYVWGKKYGKFVPVPLEIAVSISDPVATSHDDRLLGAFEELSASLLDGGHTLTYGGTPNVGFTGRLHAIDRARHADNPNSELHLVNYVADHLWSDDVATGADAHMRRRRVRRQRLPGETEVERRIADFTAMRVEMAAHADLRIVVGGAITPGAPGTRLAPGIIEEAYLAVESGQPLLVVGGFGGAAGLIADALLGRLDRRLVEELDEHFVTPRPHIDADVNGFTQMLDRFSAIGVLRNGLTDGENAELLRTHHASTISSLIRRSVYRIGNRHSS